MKTFGLVHRIDANAAIRTDVLEADSDQLALAVLRTVFGPILSTADLLTDNRLPENTNDPESALLTMTWGQWQSLNPVTVLGAHALHRGSGSAPIWVLAGPDSGFAIDIDPHSPQLSRVASPGSLIIVDPCMSRQPADLELAPARRQSFAHLGTTVFSPSLPSDAHVEQFPRSGLSSGTGQALRTGAPARLNRHRPHRHRDPIHVAPTAVDDPRPAKPPQWWAFLIPIGIGAVLALVTGMWWFLLFSVSAPVSGYIAYAMEKRRFARDSHQCVIDRQAASDRARAELASRLADHRKTLQTGSGLCLGFGAVLSHITIAEVLFDSADQLEGCVIIDDVPIRIDPLTTSVTVTGEYDQLRRMALSWLIYRAYRWSPSSGILELPELQGTRFDAGFTVADNQALSPSSARLPPEAHPDALIGIHLSTTGDEAVLRLEAPAATAEISLALGSLAHARTTDSSTTEGGPVPGRSLIASLMPPGRFLTLERRHTNEVGLERLPDHGLGDLYDDGPQAISSRWETPSSGPVLIGRGLDGNVGIDLFNDGPHALVAGTTGSGKSILLQTWLLAMALEHPPRRLTFVLIDFKGGATFASLEDLPHTDCVLDDFDSAAAFRALVSVRAEITRRERLLADHGCSDVLSLSDPPPRLVVVIDEFHALMATHPKAAELLEHLTALGRSLGVHLILATQRPLGVVTGHMKANINIRMCLRVRDDADSFDVIGVDDAARLPPDKPGAACLDSGSSIIQFRVAVPFAARPPAEAVYRPRLRPWSRGQGLPTRSEVNGVRVDCLRQAAALATDGSPSLPPSRHPVVLPALPTLTELVDSTVLTESTAVTGGNALDGSVLDGSVLADRWTTGIVDIPSHQSQHEWSYTPVVDGSCLLVGRGSSTVTSVLARMSASAARTHRIVALGRIATTLDRAEISSGMETGWKLHAILDHLSRHRADVAADDHSEDVPTLVVCGNWSEFIDSMDHHQAAAAEQLLKHGAGLGLTFLLAGCRTATSTSADFRTQIIFPPAAGGDGLTVGLSRQRFVGTWPEYRAVLLGPSAQDAGSDGADVQLIPHPQEPVPGHGAQSHAASSCSPGPGAPRFGSPVSGPPGSKDVCLSGIEGSDPGFEPRWHGLGERLLPTRTSSTDTAIPLGVDPFGEVVAWNPVRDGPVLTVRGSSQSGKTTLTRLLRSTCTTHDDAHLAVNPDDIDLLDGRVHVVTIPMRFTPGYGSPLAKAQGVGPMLILGAHSRQDLSNLGLLRLPPLDGDAGVAWFVTEQRTRAVRIFPAEADAIPRGVSAFTSQSH